jgi:hypothetical protein
MDLKLWYSRIRVYTVFNLWLITVRGFKQEVTIMRASIGTVVLCGLICAASASLAQRGVEGDRLAAASGADEFVAKLMKFDKNKDGKLTKDEITDERLLPLFERADANHDGVVTADELRAFYAKEGANLGSGQRGRRGPGDKYANADDPRGQRRGPTGQDPDRPGSDGPGPGDSNGPGEGPGPGPGFGPGGPGGFGPPQPGQVLPERLQEMLKLTADQKKQLADLQKEVNEKLSKILTSDQQKQLKEMRNRRGPQRDGGPNGQDRGPGIGGLGGNRGGPGGRGGSGVGDSGPPPAE